MISIEYIKSHQDEKDHIETMKQIFLYADTLLHENNSIEFDRFIEEFCNENICFQYYVSMMTTALWWNKDELKNLPFLKFCAIEAGSNEIGYDSTIKTLHGLL